MSIKPLFEKVRDKTWLYQKYVTEQLTTRQIASLLGAAQRTIVIWLHKLAIPVREPNYAHVSEQWLRQKYLIEKLTVQQISKLAGISRDTVYYKLKGFHIPVSKHNKQRVSPLNDKKVFEDFYITQGRSLAWLSRKFNLDPVTLRSLKNKLGIPTIPSVGSRAANYKHGLGQNLSNCVDCGKSIRTRCTRCRRCNAKYYSRAYAGHNAHAYKGISSINVIVRSWIAENWRWRVFDRDNRTCLLCGDTRKDRLQAHHIISVGSIINATIKKYKNKLDLTTAIGREKLATIILKNKSLRDVNNGITVCKACHGIFHGRNEIKARRST